MIRLGVDWLDRKLYPGFQRNWDDHLFRAKILEHLKPEHELLDLGAGAGIVEQMNFRGLAKKVCGVDLDERVTSNPCLDEGKIADAEKIPYSEASFDMVISDNVMEHIVDPTAVLREIYRVLKPGGVFMFKTPNKNHYMPLIARLTPHRFHQYVNRLRGRAVEDTFPTQYKANCPKDIAQLSNEAGLEIGCLELCEGRPEYLRFNFLTYLVGAAYEKAVNSTNLLASFRVLLIARLVKPERQ